MMDPIYYFVALTLRREDKRQRRTSRYWPGKPTGGAMFVPPPLVLTAEREGYIESLDDFAATHAPEDP